MFGTKLSTSNLSRLVGAALLVLSGRVSGAADAGGPALAGAVLDPLGGRIPGAAVSLLREGTSVADVTADGQGQYSFAAVERGRYRLRASAPGFETQTTRPFFFAAGGRAMVDVSLQIGLRQDVVVTASGTEEQPAQVAAPVTVIARQTIDDLAKPLIGETLRLVPGAQVVQTAGRGGVTSLFVRGGSSNFNKVVVDGVAVNDIGGAFDYSGFLTTGVESVEALRDANSVVYGSDAMSAVISVTTRRGETRTPELEASLDGGNLGTHHEELSLGGAAGRIDYFGAYSHFETDNDAPNNAWKNDSFAGRASLAIGSRSDVSASFRHARDESGVPNGLDLFGIADDSFQDRDFTYVGLAARSQLTTSWSGILRASWFDDGYEFVNPAPTGEPFDPFGFGANYLGQTLTIVGANGTRATGQAILDYGGSYPQPLESRAKRRAISAQTDYQVAPAFTVSAGARFEHEEGFVDSSFSRSETDRDNYGGFVELRAKLRRFYANAGIGYDHNQVFQSAWTPRLSTAFYLREPSASDRVGDTKLVFSVGRGIKAPNLSQELSSLYELLQTVPGVSASVDPIGPERARSLDVGVEQGLLRSQLRLRASYFDNDYTDLIEFLGEGALVSLGVPPDVAGATGFGAYVNAASYRARGVELSTEAAFAGRFRAMASYTYLDAEVDESFSSSALAPVENPSYPGVPIGAYGPLVGARPFRRPKHSGNFLLTYAAGPAQVSLAGYLVGSSDDSTFLSDGYFGYSMLLPNEDLNAGYQKLDLSGSYRLLRSRLKVYASIENLLDQDYTPQFGFPALPRTFRAGVTGTFGGDPRP
jgi:iron complex outermembrane receptor protein/vitamin B12 transporter